MRASSRAWVHDEKRLSGQVAMELKTCRAELATCHASLLDSNKARDKFSSDISQMKKMIQSEQQAHYGHMQV